MIIVIFLFISIVATFLVWFIEKDEEYYIQYSKWEIYPYEYKVITFADCCLIGVWIVAITMIIAFMCSFFDKTSNYNDWIQRRNSIQYQLDCSVNIDSSLYKQIENFNRELGVRKGRKQDILLGVFYCTDYDKIDYIEYPEHITDV